MSKREYYTRFVDQPNDTVVLQLQSKDEGKPDWKTVEGVDFSKASEETRFDFLNFYNRQLGNYLSKGRTGNFSMHAASKHDGGYEHTIREEIEYWAQKGVVML
jgi:hypothetical protein